MIGHCPPLPHSAKLKSGNTNRSGPINSAYRSRKKLNSRRQDDDVHADPARRVYDLIDRSTDSQNKGGRKFYRTR